MNCKRSIGLYCNRDPVTGECLQEGDFYLKQFSAGSYLVNIVTRFALKSFRHTSISLF